MAARQPFKVSYHKGRIIKNQSFKKGQAISSSKGQQGVCRFSDNGHILSVMPFFLMDDQNSGL
jgi:hypothetical protein